MRTAAGHASTRWLRTLAAAALALAVPVGGPAAAQSLERAIKAAFLPKFAAFVDWPDDAFDGPTSPIALCVVGDDPFGDLLDRSVAEQPPASRTFAVQRLKVVDPGARCHVMYVAGSRQQPVEDVLRTVRGTPVLTITDAEPQASAKGIVNFVLNEGKVRFEMDAGAAAENGITISSKLLGLAVSVRRRG
ncbi:YfiR family protein [Arenibaculum pallidiluteum]|uniref:YfiR family protein n=1 Tax=Arenibaculum pallidiluteum TaxID=2812559 RepID=UPI001A9591B1|nr:YfiR family protein [Arenibaculum pallidiluteum]